MKKIAILGSTGSIGTQTLEVTRTNGDLDVVALAAGNNIELLEKQIREFHPKLAAVWNEKKAAELKNNIQDLNVKVVTGLDGLLEVAAIEESEILVTAIVGMIGILPTIEAIKAGKDIALANKETLVTAGHIIMKLAKEYNINIYPVDSEHSAIFQSLNGEYGREAEKILLTASGGPFRGKDKEFLKTVTLKDALNHPNWSMGAKITIDSASMMNKGLEIIEASWLFDMPQDKIDVVVHRESIIHSMIEFVDNSVIAQLGLPDMRIPIQYAITFPNRYESPVKELDLTEISNLSFYKPDYETFKCLRACKKAIEIGKTAPAIANGANEVANKMFRDGKIKFLEIGDLVYDALNNVEVQEIKRVEDVLNADKSARQYVLDSVK